MVIRIVYAKEIPRFILRHRIKKMYHLEYPRYFIWDYFGNFQIFISKHTLSIRIYKEQENSIKLIGKMLDFVFKNSYIGLDAKDYNLFELKNVRKYELSRANLAYDI